MPAGSTPKKISAIDALETIQDNIDTLEDVGASEEQADFLQDFFDNPAIGALLEMYDDLTEGDLPDAEDEEGREVFKEVLDIMKARAATNSTAKQLRDVLNTPHFKALMRTHDSIAQEDYGMSPVLKSHDLPAPPPPAFDHASEEHRLVTITKQGKEPLGITVSLDRNNDLIIARILQGSLADKQGLLHVDDKVREVNGIEVYTPEDMMLLLKEATTSVTMKIVPSYRNIAHSEQFFVRANFNYDPANDRLIPCKKAGLPFREGDVLEVVSTNDENWWQARSVIVVDGTGPVGLIPSRTLQEKRSAFVQPAIANTETNLLCGLKMKRKKHIKYNSYANTEFDNCDIKVYEEVTLSNFHTRVLALVGSRKVGKRSLIAKLVSEHPRRYQAAVPFTTKPKGPKDVDGQGYYFTDRDTMQNEIRENKFLDYGEYSGELYGIKFSTVRAIIKTGKVCVLAISPAALKVIKSPDFQPFIIFIAAPSVEALKVMIEEHKLRKETGDSIRRRSRASRPSVNELFQEEQFIATVKESRSIEKTYRGYFDDSVVNDDFDTTYMYVLERIKSLHRGAKWIPVDWKDE